MGKHVDLDHIVSIHEIRVITGLTLARINQLIRSDPSFPAPVKQLKLTKLWLSTDIEHWLKVRVINAPGRKKKTGEVSVT